MRTEDAVDDLIEGVARQMTQVDEASHVRPRVMAALVNAPRTTPRPWVLPAALAATVATAVLAVTLWNVPGPSEPMGPTAQVATAGPAAPGTVHVPETGSAPPVEAVVKGTAVTGNAGLRPVAPHEVAPEVPTSGAWGALPVEDIPSLPPLAEAPAIEVSPLTWEAVSIAPVAIDPIEMKTIAVAPGAIGFDGGA